MSILNELLYFLAFFGQTAISFNGRLIKNSFKKCEICEKFHCDKNRWDVSSV